MSQKKTTGHCYCGAIQFEVTGDPGWVTHCHCESCRRHSASVMATFAGYSSEQLTFTAARPASFSSDDVVKRSFCGQCGSPISYESPRWPGQVHLYLGIFDEPENFQPEDHSYCAEQIPWLHIDDGLPRYAESGDGN